MEKSPRENRVPIMMSDDELAAIDDWRFQNRVATRSAAIRRLARLGIGLDQRTGELSEAAIAAFDRFSADALVIGEIAKNSEEDVDRVSALALDLISRIGVDLANLVSKTCLAADYAMIFKDPKGFEEKAYLSHAASQERYEEAEKIAETIHGLKTEAKE